MNCKTYDVTEADGTIDLLYYSAFNKYAGFPNNGYSHYDIIYNKVKLHVPIPLLIFMIENKPCYYICKVSGNFYKYYRFSLDTIILMARLFKISLTNS
jgi:hypothetical protein